MMEKIQRAIKMITQICEMSYREMLVVMKIPTLKREKKRGRLDYSF